MGERNAGESSAGPPARSFLPGGMQTSAERDAGLRLVELFESSSDPLEARLAAFPRYARRAHITRFIALYELFKLALPVKGSVVECGVFRGFSLMTWAKLSAVLEPNNLTRRIYGFDSFAGFPDVSPADSPERTGLQLGDLHGTSLDELRALVDVFDQDRFLGHIPKVELVEGDLIESLPRFLATHEHLVVSLLYLDVDLYEPTKLALELLLPRMPKGAILAFDELDNPSWPGETMAAIEAVGLRELELLRFGFDPYIAYVRLG